MPEPYNLTQTGEQVQSILDLIEKGLVPSFNSSFIYAVGDLVVYETKIYKCIKESSVPVQPGPESEYWQEVNLNILFKEKQNVISDLDTIRTGSNLGSTALQPDALTDYETFENTKTWVLNQSDLINYYTSNYILSNYYTSAQTDSAITEAISSVYRYKGSKHTYDELPESGNVTGDVWNIETADPSHDIEAGDNVAWTGTQWDKLSGIIDLSSFATQQWVLDKGYLTAVSWNDISNIPSDLVYTADLNGFATETYVQSYHDTTKQNKLPDVNNSDRVLVSTGSNTYEWREIEDVGATVLYLHTITLRTEWDNVSAYLSFSFYDDSEIAYANKAALSAKYNGIYFVSTGNIMGQNNVDPRSHRTGIMLMRIGGPNPGDSWSGINSSNTEWTFWPQEFTSSTVKRVGAVALSTEWDNILNKPNVATQEWVQSGFTINGNLEVTGTITASSDRRLKENIKLFIPKKSILDLPVVEYDYIDNKQHKIGCIAQDLQEICPELIYKNCNGYLSVEENKLVYLLLLEVKKLRNELDELKGK